MQGSAEEVKVEASDSSELQKQLEDRILLVRGTGVILDADLARFFGVPTRRLNEQVKRNLC